jgi:hypothetical protein
VIFCRTPGSTHPEADFALLRNENDKWRVVWNSMRESEWIATDGDVKYLADDLSLLLVTGSADFGINDVEESVRNKIIENVERKGTDRQLASFWEKKGGTYVRKSKLPHDAPLYERLLEMTE